jgi:mannose-6-phosphate isomerase-like protein (cupin superfamily)
MPVVYFLGQPFGLKCKPKIHATKVMYFEFFTADEAYISSMKLFYSLLFVAFSAPLFSQHIQNTDTIQCPQDFENVCSRLLYSDSLCSSFVIFIKKEVKLHKHLYHTEHVTVLEGEATMTLGEKVFTIKKGDFIFIPKNTPHKVVTTSNTPLKVISLQAPYFDGNDRVLLE